MIADVGTKLQGEGGAGIFSEQQESIAEIMWTPMGRSCPTMTSGGGSWRCRVGSSSPLFLFFISEDNKLNISELDHHEVNRARFVAKLDHEVGATIEALARLETRLTDICGLRAASPRTATADETGG